MDQKEVIKLPPEMVILFGIKHSGKSSIGKMLSDALNWSFCDLDDCIETQTQALMGVSIRDFLRIEEKKRFFRIETNCFDNFLRNNSTPWILATGGGIIDNESALKIVPERAIKVFLHNEPEVLYERIAKSGLPPYLSDNDPYGSFLNIYHSRASRYKKIADIIIDRKDCSKEQSTEKIIISLKEFTDAR